MNLPVLSEATHKGREPFKEPLVYSHIYIAIRVNGETLPTKETMNVFCNILQQQPQVNHTLSDCNYNVNAAEGSWEKVFPSRNQCCNKTSVESDTSKKKLRSSI